MAERSTVGILDLLELANAPRVISFASLDTDGREEHSGHLGSSRVGECAQGHQFCIPRYRWQRGAQWASWIFSSWRMRPGSSVLHPSIPMAERSTVGILDLLELANAPR